MMVRKVNFKYYVKEESVTLVIPRSQRLGDAYISFNCYSLQNKRKFNSFVKVIVESERKEYDNINDIYGLAREYGIIPTAGRRPTRGGQVKVINRRIAF